MAESARPTSHEPHEVTPSLQANNHTIELMKTSMISLEDMGVSQFEAVPKMVRSRASKPKVKTGCLSCRKRHVKCDEGRPECARCLKIGTQCTGYFLDRLPRPKVKVSSVRPLLPRKDDSSGLALARPSTLLLNESEIEHRYFQHFQDQTMSSFLMNFNNSLWNRLVLQTSRHEPFVRYAVVAIGAISKSLQIDPLVNRASQPARDINQQKEMANLHRKFAFLEYSKSLKEMKDIISKADFTPRQALLASLLSFCFENFIGNRPVAMYHAQSGHQILQNWISDHPHSILYNEGISSPAPHVIEDDLVHAFAQLDLQILTIADARGHEFHDSFKHLGDSTVANMPAVFKDINEARSYWDVVMARSYHFLLTAWEMSRSGELARPFTTKSPSHSFITNSSKTLYGTPNVITDEMIEQQQIYAKEVYRWLRAFGPVWTSLSNTTGNKELFMAAMILINCIALEIMLAAVVFPDQSSYDVFEPSFRQIVDLVETRVLTGFDKTAKSLDGGFLLDLGITSPLGVVVMRCRDRVIRRRAIAILRSWFTEGPTDPEMVSQIGTFMMEIEEEGNEDGIIPESSRAFPTLYCLDSVNNTILMQFCQRKGGLDGGPVWKEQKFCW